MKEFSTGETPGDPDSPYGICGECEKFFKNQQARDLERLIANLQAPTLLVNQELRVVAHNESCWQSFCGGASKPLGLRTGEFLGCQNALLAQRCGGTAFCLDCAIRRSAVETLKTGKPQKNVRAHLNRMLEGRKERLELLVSTNPIGDLVKIKVESLFTVLETPPDA